MHHLFARASIRSKIIAAFAFVLMTTIGVGLFSMQRMSMMNCGFQRKPPTHSDLMPPGVLT